MKVLFELRVHAFHFHDCLNNCLNAVARLDAYETSTTTLQDHPVKIRQDMLATKDIVDLALNLRRISELTNSMKRMKAASVPALNFVVANSSVKQVKKEEVSLYKLASRIIHSKTCAIYRDFQYLNRHFDIKLYSKSLRDSKIATKAVLLIDTQTDPKRVCALRDGIDCVYAFLEFIFKKNSDVYDYISKRTF